MTFDVHVIDEENRSQSGLCVEVDLPESFSTASDKVTAFTDEDGHASFETTTDAFGEVTIYVSGENKGRFDLEDRAGLTVVV